MRNRGRPGQARGRPETARRRARRQSESPDRANPVSWANPRFDVDPGIVGVSLSANRRAKAVPLGRCTGSPGKRYVGIHRFTAHRLTVSGQLVHDPEIGNYSRVDRRDFNSALQRSSSPPPSTPIASCVPLSILLGPSCDSCLLMAPLGRWAVWLSRHEHG
jgi:hypothetical protein